MIKINNNIILEIDGKYFNTFENNIHNIKNKHKKKYKNVTKIILQLQDRYGIEHNVNYILNEEDKKNENINKNNEKEGGGDIKDTTKNIKIHKKFLDGGSWQSNIEKEDEEKEEKEDDGNIQEGSGWLNINTQRGGGWGQLIRVEDR